MNIDLVVDQIRVPLEVFFREHNLRANNVARFKITLESCRHQSAFCEVRIPIMPKEGRWTSVSHAENLYSTLRLLRNHYFECLTLKPDYPRASWSDQIPIFKAHDLISHGSPKPVYPNNMTWEMVDRFIWEISYKYPISESNHSALVSDVVLVGAFNIGT